MLSVILDFLCLVSYNIVVIQQTNDQFLKLIAVRMRPSRICNWNVVRCKVVVVCSQAFSREVIARASCGMRHQMFLIKTRQGYKCLRFGWDRCIVLGFRHRRFHECFLLCSRIMLAADMLFASGSVFCREAGNRLG